MPFSRILSTLALSLVALALILAPPPAHAARAPDVLLSVGKHGADKEWAHSACQLLYGALAKASLDYEPGVSEMPRSRCYWKKDDFHDPELHKLARSGVFKFLVELVETGERRFLRVVNLQREDETDFEQLDWRIDNSKAGNLAILKLVRNVIALEGSKDELKALMVAHAAEDKNGVIMDKSGNVLDPFTYDPLTLKQAYGRVIAEKPENKNYLRAALESAAVLGVGAWLYYGRDLMKNRKDWRYPKFKDSVSAKIRGEGILFDDNAFAVNFAGHAFGGYLYYSTARANGLSAFESFTMSFIASLAWEAGVEYREVLSINDQVLTPVGGAIIGESFFQISRFLRKSGDSTWKKVVGAAFDPNMVLNNTMDRKSILNANGADRLTGKFEVMIGAESVSGGGKASEKNGIVAIDSEVFNLGEMEAAGHKKQLITDTAFAQFLLKLPMESKSREEFLFYTKTVWAAYHLKDMQEDAAGRASGYSLFIGPSSAFEYTGNLSEPKGPNRELQEDFFGIVHVLGSTLDFTMVFQQKVKLRFTLDVFGDYALMRNYAFERYAAANGVSGIDPMLRDHRYYHGIGVTSQGKIVAIIDRWELGMSYRQSNTDSVNRRRDNEEQITSDLELSDSYTKKEIWVSYEIARNLKVKLNVAEIRRAGTAKGFSHISDRERRVTTHLVYAF